MKPTTIEFFFDDAKLEAINIFLRDNDATLTEELDRFMDSIYEEYVPKEVRDFIEKKEAEANKAASPKRNGRRKQVSARNAVSGDETDDGTSTRTNEEKPV